ncbi:DNA polymerase III subunit beta [Clostridium botulinum]|uniref:DNA polymerase III subunit beta n=1 Tax=Clostridium botulinum TaxID=1491 RepID=UPI001A92721E|nr:DNA polymerase III subunit beta [Clostridium botulinum]MBO0526663.1 DNA polymerase III subunit beta [Clostridium botulinum]MBO0526972.1 DNA polymerase III subunit beta [Clostridium botulinum]MBO0532514.1 DNA polymerase III subunit beta [Clostridium botulinum]MBO0534377.1 DNA polymerase III subunit beta [Clostridium botulinum]MBO0538895.1 DNA polymerase III subunit beta [Clostridium botulinum]
MNIKVNGGEFKKYIGLALKSTASSAVNANDIINISTDTGKLIILSGSSDFTLKQELSNIIISEEGNINISVTILNAIIKKMTNEEISLFIDPKNNDVLKIKQGRNNSKIALAKEHTISDILKSDIIYSLNLNPKIFKDLIESTSYAVAQDEARPILLGQYIELENNLIKITALDGFRLISNSAKIENKHEDKILIHANNLKNLSSLIDDSTEELILNKNNNKAIVEVKNKNYAAIAASNIFSEEFIEYKQLIGDLSSFPIKITVDRLQLLNTVDRISVVSSFVKEGTHILMKLNKDSLEIDGNSSVASMKGEVNIKNNNFEEEFTIGFNPKYILDALKNINTKEIDIFFNSNVSPAIIINKPEKEDIKINALVLPVKTIS